MCAWKVTGIVADEQEPAPQEPSSQGGSQYRVTGIVDSPQQPPQDMNLQMDASPDGMKPSVSEIAETLGQMESSGNYNARGKPVRGMSAIGKYQVMPQNVPEWSKEVLGKSITAEEFANSPELQDKIVYGKVGNLLAAGNSPQDVAAIWLSGRPLKGNTRKDTVAGTDVPSYVDKFNKLLGMPKQALMSAAASLHQSPKLEKFVNTVTPYVSGITEAAASPVFGALQGLGEAATSAANLPIEGYNALMDTDYKIPSPNLRGATSDGLINNFLFSLGDILGQAGGGGAAFKALGAVPKLGNEASVIANLFRGAGAGALTGEDAPGGRTLSAVLGGLLAPASKLTSSSMASRFANQAEQAENKATQGYNRVFADLPKDEIVMPEGDINFSSIRKAIPNKERGAFDEYLKDPNIENAHRAQSILGSQERNIENEIVRNGNTFGRTKRLNDIRDAKKSIQEGLKATMDKFPGKSAAYAKETQNYAENVVPYKVRELNQYRQGDLSSGKTVDALLKRYADSPNFKNSTIGRQNAQSIAVKRFLNSILNKELLKYGGAGALGALGLSEGKKAYNAFEQ